MIAWPDMNGSRAALRKLLLLGVVGLFAFARLADAGVACELMSIGCVPAAVTAAGHGGAHVHGDACAVPLGSPQSGPTKAPGYGGAHALQATTAITSSLPVVLQIARTAPVERVRRQPSSLAFFGRLRL